VRYRLVDYLPDDPTDSEVRKRIWYALSRSDIEIPYASHNVYLTENTQARKLSRAERERERRLDLLGHVAIFAPLGKDERLHLCDAMHHTIFGAGETIMRFGAPGDSLYVLRAGEVSVRLVGGGIEREVARLGTRDFFGEMSLMTGEPRNATIVAVKDAECYVIDSAAIKQILHDNATLAGEIGRLLSQREMKNKIELEGMSAEAASRHADHERLLQRIKAFFGLAESDG
jgi:CRP-like cAMP-binding protein